jgi:hypothetical protein
MLPSNDVDGFVIDSNHVPDLDYFYSGVATPMQPFFPFYSIYNPTANTAGEIGEASVTLTRILHEAFHHRDFWNVQIRSILFLI